MIGSVIVAGSDGIAVRLVEELVLLGEAVSVLAREMEPRFRTHLEREGVRVLEGDPRDVSDLQLAGLDSAVAAFDARAGTAELFPAAASGVLALVPDDEPDEDEATAVEAAVEAAVGELRQAASLHRC